MSKYQVLEEEMSRLNILLEQAQQVQMSVTASSCIFKSNILMMCNIYHSKCVFNPLSRISHLSGSHAS